MIEEPKSNSRIPAACLSVLGILFFLGLAAICASWVSFRFWAAKTHSLSNGSGAAFFTRQFFEQMRLRLALMGAGNVVAALLLFRVRSRVYRVVRSTAADSLPFFRDMQAAFAAVPRSDFIALIYLTALAVVLRIRFLRQP
ncbi:MAG TPA: hypothetical protein VLV49_11995 [Terriglobales bacterium]|nr:hypothetical protein [Terriglobales bacterium]